VEWISQLCVLIMIEVLQLEELLKIWAKPRDDPDVPNIHILTSSRVN
jgi:hypothetical protein